MGVSSMEGRSRAGDGWWISLVAWIVISGVIPACVGSALADDPGPPAKALPDDDGYTAVRDDVLATLNAESKLLGECQGELRAAQDDVRRQTAVARDYQTAVAELRRQKAELVEYARLVRDLAPAPDGGWGWEDIDGSVGLGTGYVLGTAQCLGLAWAFNQPAFGGGN